MSVARPESKERQSTKHMMTALASPPKRKTPCQKISDFYHYLTTENLLIPTIKRGFGSVIKENFEMLAEENRQAKAIHQQISSIKKGKIGPKTIHFVSGPSEIQQLARNYSFLRNKETSVVQKILIGEESIVAIPASHSAYRQQRDMVLDAGFTEDLTARIAPAMRPYFEEIFKSEKNLADLASRMALANTGMLLGFDEHSFLESDKTELAHITHQIIAKLANPLTIARITLEDILSNSCISFTLDRHLHRLLKSGEDLIRRVINRNRPKVLQTLRILTKKSTLTDKDLDTKKTMSLIKLFLIGGSDSTSKLLLFSMLMLGFQTNAEFLNKIQDELKNLPKPIEKLSYKELEELHYLNAFIFEVLRLYPPFAYMRHTAEKEFSLAHNIRPNTTRADYKADIENPSRNRSTDSKILPNDILITSIYDAHRNSEYFGENANEFDPLRWLRKDKSLIRDTISIPRLFTLGNDPRTCAGRFIAVQMAMVMLANFINAEIDIQHNLTMPLPVTPDFTLNLSSGVVATGIFTLRAQKIKEILFKEGQLPEAIIDSIVIPYTGMKLNLQHA